MASTNKTSLGLNRWEASDKPIRQDFVNDNVIIDENLSKLKNDFNNVGQYVYSSINATTYTAGMYEREIAWVTIPSAGTWLVGFKTSIPINFVLVYGDEGCMKNGGASSGSSSGIVPLVITEGGKKLSLRITVFNGSVTTTNDLRFDRIFGLKIR